MSDLAERYARLCRGYVQLAEKFQKLDVEHMTLRSKVIPLLKSLKSHHSLVEQLKQEKESLEEQLQSTIQKYEELKALETFLQPEMQAALLEAEEQIALVETTVSEMDSDFDPDLSDDEKMLLHEYHSQSEFGSLIKIPAASPASYPSPVA
jgi:predicted nuclease with TOPRIM domain